MYVDLIYGRQNHNPKQHFEFLTLNFGIWNFLDLLHKSFLDQVMLDLRNKKWAFLNQVLPEYFLYYVICMYSFFKPANWNLSQTWSGTIRLDRITNLDHDHCCRYLHWSNSMVHVFGAFLQLVPWHNEALTGKGTWGETGGRILKISNIPQESISTSTYSDPPANQRKPENGRSWTLPPRSGLILKSSTMMTLHQVSSPLKPVLPSK